MGRRRKKDAEIDFQYFREQLPDSLKEALNEQEINSIEDYILLMLKDGYDPEKFYSLPQQVGNLDCLSIDDIAIEKGTHAEYLHQRLQELENENFSTLPSGLLLGNECAELFIRIRLNDAPVLIWRELRVPSNLSLELLALILMKAMGWQNVHLHQFRKGDILFKNTENLQETLKMLPSSPHTIMYDTNKIAVGNLLKEKGDRMKFEYDFGDSWIHDVWLKSVREYAPGEIPKVELVRGRGACPPENSGGIWGYTELIETNYRPRKSKEDKELLAMFDIDRNFSPYFFDLPMARSIVNNYWSYIEEEIDARWH